MAKRPILCIDFDGVVHRYSRGWQDGFIYDEMIDGFAIWAKEATRFFELHIYSSRSASEIYREQMRVWLLRQLMERLSPDDARILFNEITFCHEKPPAFLTIDDRAIQFRGDWSAWWLAPQTLLQFKPWMQEEKPMCMGNLSLRETRLERACQNIVRRIDSSMAKSDLSEEQRYQELQYLRNLAMAGLTCDVDYRR